jgi:PBP1b-binding outer membrane lipoprotein LpoB
MRRLTLVVAAFVVLAGCTGDETDSPETTIAAVDTTVTTAAPTTTSTEAATTTTQPMDPDAACIECHTDQETLVALAVEPIDSESLSSGEG